MIELSHVTKTFGGKKALDELSLRVPQGAVYGLIGSNGAGKSTAIRHLTGIYRPDAGAVTIGGLPVYENPEIKSRIGYIPDDLGVLGGGTIRELAAFYRAMYPRFDAARFDALREVFCLDERTPLRRFSKGMQKHAAFWLTLCIRPDYLVLDEPVDGLDPVMRRQVWNLVLADVAENGTTVLISSHNLRELEDVCDHVGIMNGGKVLLEHPLSELQANIVKVLVALPDGTELPEGLDILHRSSQGHLHTLIVHGDAAEVTNRLSTAQPQYLDVVPLTLEEIFIYELGGADYAVKDILL
jgi:ABC-2 type transport system ATP-binding protein